MTNYKPGDVVLLELVFTEKTGKKKRPALVISSNDYNKNRQEVVILAITSNIKRTLAGDTRIENWKEAGLLYPSLVTGIIQTIKQDMVIRKLGTLPTQDLEKVYKNLKQIFCNL